MVAIQSEVKTSRKKHRAKPDLIQERLSAKQCRRYDPQGRGICNILVGVLLKAGGPPAKGAGGFEWRDRSMSTWCWRLGSIAGFELTHRRSRCGPAAPPTHQQAPDVSAPGKRRPLLLGADEAAILHLRPRGRQLVINPLECVVCLACPREVAFSCGHFMSCRACSGRLPTCPVCRKPVDSSAFVQRTQSYVARRD